MKIFVGNIANEATVHELRQLFEQYGRVRDCDIIKHYGFVHMESAEEAKAAIAALHQYELHGRKLNVDESRGRPASVTKIYVGNIGPACTNQELRAKFEEYGRVSECDIVKDYAFVHMEREEDAIEAINSLDETEFNGSKIRVQLSKSTYGKAGGGGGGGLRDMCQRCGRQGHSARDCYSARFSQYSQYDFASPYYSPYYSYYGYGYGHNPYFDYYQNYQNYQTDGTAAAAVAAASYHSMGYMRERSPTRYRSPTSTSLYERTRLSPPTASKYQTEKFVEESINRLEAEHDQQ